jgi:hypothetical protein
MAQDVIILLWANPFRGPLEAVGPENYDFLCPEMAMSEASTILVQKSQDFQGPTLPMAQVMDFPRSKSLCPKRHIKSSYIGNFMYMSFAAAVFFILYLYSVFSILYSVFRCRVPRCKQRRGD